MDADKIAALLAEWHPTQLVVGMPAHADGSPSDLQEHVDGFIDDLKTHGLPVDTIDERYTSLEAERVLRNARQAGTRGRISKDQVDSAAAVFIAERYLSSE